MKNLFRFTSSKPAHFKSSPFFCSLLAASFVFLIQTEVKAIVDPTVVDAKFSTAYIADGFDNNDRIQIVGEGVFSNTCYRAAPISFEVNQTTKTIHLFPKAFFYGGMCLQVIVPYHQVIEIGLLKEGTYKIIQGSGKEPLGEIMVRPASTNDADDYLYAPISQAYVRGDAQQVQELILQGTFTNSCLKIAKILVDVQERVIVAQPIAEFTPAEPGATCQEGQFRFEESFKLEKIKAGRYLLHVRSVNGQAFNYLLDIK